MPYDAYARRCRNAMSITTSSDKVCKCELIERLEDIDASNDTEGQQLSSEDFRSFVVDIMNGRSMSFVLKKLDEEYKVSRSE